ncbi:MAG: hypothetical protein WA705_22305 [Candidatus Ozemobacteraceae bacterium]
MKKEVGVWIDHRNAVITVLTKGKGKALHVEAEIEKHARISSGSRPRKPYGSLDVLVEDRYQRNIQGHLSKYYDEVISNIGEAESVLVFGPGEAKIELKKRMEMEKPMRRTVAVEPADRMTDNEIVEKVQQYFSHKTMVAE